MMKAWSVQYEIPYALQCFQEFDERFLLIIFEISSVDMTLVAIAAKTGVVKKEAAAGRSICGQSRHKSYLFPVVEVIAPAKLFRAVFRLFQKVDQGRHRAVVQVGRPEPDAVKRQVAVTAGLHEF